MTLDLTDVGSGFNLSAVNTNFAKIEETINNDLLNREPDTGQANEMRTHLDMNTNTIVNTQTDLSDPTSLITVGAADARYAPINDSVGGVAGDVFISSYANLAVGNDWSAAIVQAVMDANGRLLHLEGLVAEANFNISGYAVNITGEGAVLTGDMTFTGGTSTILPGETSLEAIEGVSALTITDTTGIEQGTLLAILDPADFSWSKEAFYHHKSEFNEVMNVTGNVLDLYFPTQDTYVSGSHLYNMSSVPCRVTEVTFVSDTEGVIFTHFHHIDLSICGLDNSNIGAASITLSRCFQGTVNVTARESSLSLIGLNYGVSISNCQSINIQGTASAGRHAVGLGGSPSLPNPITRDIKINDMTLSSNIGTLHASDVHPNCDRITYNNCTILGGIAFGGRNVTYIGCTSGGLNPAVSNPLGANLDFVIGGTHKVIGHTFRMMQVLDNSSFFQMELDTELQEDLTILFDGCVFNLPLSNEATISLSGTQLLTNGKNVLVSVANSTFNTPNAPVVLRSTVDTTGRSVINFDDSNTINMPTNGIIVRCDCLGTVVTSQSASFEIPFTINAGATTNNVGLIATTAPFPALFQVPHTTYEIILDPAFISTPDILAVRETESVYFRSQFRVYVLGGVVATQQLTGVIRVKKTVFQDDYSVV